MKVLSLWQPWATLVALGCKRIETRGYPCFKSLIGQRVAIHATLKKEWLYLADDGEPFSRRLREALELGGEDRISDHLPLGGIVATAVITDTRGITTMYSEQVECETPDEFAFGNFALGRHAWELRDVERVEPYIPMKGKQGIFPVPDHQLMILRARGYSLARGEAA